MGLPGTPTFTDVRTAIATHAKNTHCPEDRHKVAQFMCHTTTTADRFYALNLNAKQAAEHRRLFDTAVVGEEAEEAEEADSPRQQGAKKRKVTKPHKMPAEEKSPSTSPMLSNSPPDAEEGQKSGKSASERSTLMKMVLRRRLMVKISPLKSPREIASKKLVEQAKKRLER